LIEHVASTANLTKASAGRVVNAFIGGITETLSNDDFIDLEGFGLFAVATVPGPTVCDPETGEPVLLTNLRAPKFRASLDLKTAVKNG